MKKIIPILFVMLTSSAICLAQPYSNQKLTYLDENGQPTKEKKASFLRQQAQISDTLWENNFYKIKGPRIISIQSTDPAGNTRNGRYVTYSESGRADTIGTYSNGTKTGRWDIYTLKGRLAEAQFYKDGQLIWDKDTLQLQHEEDSLKALRADTSKKVEIESEFPGGARSWLSYLNKNLHYPDDAVNGMIQGIVVIGFVVDTAGHIPTTSIWIDRSVGFSLDQETIRIIVNSPAWVPAIQNGRKVKSYKKQPMVFKLEVQNAR